MSTTEILVIVAAIAGLLLVTVVPILLAIWLIRRLAGGSRAQRERGDHLVATGRKARARIVGIAPTGMIVNEINIRCLVSFQITPLHGGPAFDGQKKMLINQTQMPRVGDEWQKNSLAAGSALDLRDCLQWHRAVLSQPRPSDPTGHSRAPVPR